MKFERKTDSFGLYQEYIDGNLFYNSQNDCIWRTSLAFVATKKCDTRIVGLMNTLILSNKRHPRFDENNNHDFGGMSRDQIIMFLYMCKFFNLNDNLELTLSYLSATDKIGNKWFKTPGFMQWVSDLNGISSFPWLLFQFLLLFLWPFKLPGHNYFLWAYMVSSLDNKKPLNRLTKLVFKKLLFFKKLYDLPIFGKNYLLMKLTGVEYNKAEVPDLTYSGVVWQEVGCYKLPEWVFPVEIDNESIKLEKLLLN